MLDSILLVLSSGWFDPSPLELLTYTLIMTHLTIVSVTIYLHRFSAHRSLSLHPAVQHAFRFWLWLTTGMVTKHWTAIHRKHHAKCESAQDPHSPVVLGIKKVFFEGAELYQAEGKKQETLDQFGKGTPDDWLENNIYSRHDRLGIVLMLALNWLFFGPIGLTIWAVQMLWIPVMAAGVINGIGHYWGYRNYECKDASRNILPWGILIGGEELHNNHHTFPNSPKLSSRKWEFDIGWLYIQALCFLKLASVHRLPSKLTVRDDKNSIDMDTARAIMLNRFQVLADYGRHVIKPAVINTKETTRPLMSLKQANKLLCSESSLFGEEAQGRLERLLKSNQKLEVIYDFKLSLQTIWSQRHSDKPDKPDLVGALKEWCVKAEASGIKALQDYATRIRQYSSITQTV